jgi:hypothetical protein
MAFPNPEGRPRGSKNKHVVSDLVSQNREIKAQLSRMEALQHEFLAAVARGDAPYFRSVEDALGCLEFIQQGIATGHFERAEAERHVAQLRQYIEATARTNFLSFAGGRFL